MRNPTKYLVVVVALLLLTAGPALAQKATGGLRGTVVDENAQALPGVTVTITSLALQGERVATTDTDGKFRFSLLPPGEYVASFTLANYQTVEQPDIRIVLEQTITLEVTMNSAFAEEVLVSGEAPLIDTTTTTMGTSFSPQMMQNLPTGRSFEALTFLATGAVDGGGLRDDEVGSNPSIMGSSAVENRYVVDSLDTTDTAFGKAGTSTSMNFIQEMQVKTGGYEAEFGGAIGGVINMVTKSGGNDFTGEIFGSFSNKDLWSDPVIPETRGDVKTIDQEIDYGLAIGGSLAKDRLWYFLGYNPNIRDQRVQKDVYLLQSLGGDFVRQNDFIRTYDREYFTAKLTWQVGSSNTLIANVLGDPTTLENDVYDTNYTESPYIETDQSWSTEDRGGINYGLNWNAVVSDSIVIEARYGHHAYTEENVPTLNIPNYQDQTTDGRWTSGVGQDAMFGGPGFHNIKDDRFRDQLGAAFTWYIGDNHELKIGAQWFDSSYDIDYNMVGPSDAFCAPLADPSYGVDINEWRVGVYVAPANCDSNGDGVLDGYAMPARVGNRWRVRNNYYYNRNYKNTSKGTTTEYAVYLQDSWKLSDYFTIDIGVRAEALESTGNLSETDPNAKLDFGFTDMLAPRVGFVWDFAKNGRSRAFGHYGQFFESIPLNINVRAFGNERYDFYYYDYPESGLPSTTNPGGLWYILSSGPSNTDPEIKPTYLEEIVLGAEYEVVRDLALGMKGIYRSIAQPVEDISVDGGSNYYITNPGGTVCTNPGLPDNPPIDPCIEFPRPTRYFRGIELSLNKRFSSNWQGFTSILYSELEGNYEGLYSRDNQQLDPNITSKFDLPDLLIGARGWLPNDRKWQFKAYGSYQFDFGLAAGANIQYLTGTPLNKLGAHSTYGLDERFVIPRGTGGRTPDIYTMDLRLAYPIKLGGDVALELSLDVFNVFDQQRAVELDQRWSVLDEEEAEGLTPDEQQTNDLWGLPLVYYPARNMRIGVRLSF